MNDETNHKAPNPKQEKCDEIKTRGTVSEFTIHVENVYVCVKERECWRTKHRQRQKREKDEANNSFSDCQ
jgi:hypothetical protein